MSDEPRLFQRPKWHLTPPRGWMNDPCAPFQDPDGVFHCYYQWVPASTEWSHDIGWGHAWSKDGIEWETTSEPVLMPGEAGSYDHMGVFTGGLYPGSQNTDQHLFIYSAINDLVDKEAGYVNGQERLAVAISRSRGECLQKEEQLLSVRPPAEVTGWRDPFFSSWPAVDTITGVQGQMYALIAGGVKGAGPTVFLYRLAAASSTLASLEEQWEYLGPLIRPEKRPVPPPSPWYGDLGDNWECPSFFTLGSLDFVIVGSEGKWADTSFPNSKIPSWQIWFSGQIERSADGIEFTRRSEGIVDWGNFYAAQVFKANDGRTLCIGWLVDNDLTDEGRRRQGWAGAMSSMRELYLQETQGVLGTLSGDLGIDAPFHFSHGGQGSVSTLRTLGIRPIAEICERRSAEVYITRELSEASQSFEAVFSADVADSGHAGFELVFPNGSATVQFHPKEERVVVNRSNSSFDEDINTDTEHGKHTLMRTAQGWEALELRLLYDNGILEIFANERFALSTRLYGGPCKIRILSDDGDGFKRARRWEL